MDKILFEAWFRDKDAYGPGTSKEDYLEFIFNYFEERGVIRVQRLQKVVFLPSNLSLIFEDTRYFGGSLFPVPPPGNGLTHEQRQSRRER